VPDVIVYLASVLAFSLAAVGGARLLGSRVWLGSVLEGQGSNHWPRGVQESDVPRFDLSHAAALRRERSDATTVEDLDDATSGAAAEVVEAHVHGYDHSR
jgi:hypothetical protein